MSTANNQVTAFNFNTSSIRVVTIEDQPWFVAADVLRILGVKNTTLAVRPLDNDEKGLYPIYTPSGYAQPMLHVSESGLYKLIMRSDKPVAKDFQNYVTKEILPSIRKTGSFVTGQPSLVENPQMDPLDIMLAQA